MLRQRPWNRSLALLAVLALAASNSLARGLDEDSARGGFLAITDENDAWSNFFGPHQDRHYTSGVKLTLMGCDDDYTEATTALNHFFAWGDRKSPGNLGFVIGQEMFTPENILDPQPIKTDRPYAGWLYAGMVFQRRNEISRHLATLESFEINLGIVGPESMADNAQTLIHRWRFPEDIPQGWKNQIHDEPGIVLKYARLWRYSLSDTTAKFFDVIPRAGLELGNVATFATAGVAARLGVNLPADFGVQIMDSPASAQGGINAHTPRFAAYGFAGVDGRLIAHDITLDGNSFRHSASVEKYNAVNDLSWGVAFVLWRHVEVSWAQVTRSKEFHTQRQKDVFGSINCKINFDF